MANLLSTVTKKVRSMMPGKTTDALPENAVDLLRAQHREVEAIFAEIESASPRALKQRERLFEQLALKIAVHSTIEEKIFYPQTFRGETEPLLREAVEEHLSVKRILADLMDLEPSSERWNALVKVLKEQIEHHVQEEENELFPAVEDIMDEEDLDRIGAEMKSSAKRLEETGSAVQTVPKQTGKPASLDRKPARKARRRGSGLGRRTPQGDAGA